MGAEYLCQKCGGDLPAREKNENGYWKGRPRKWCLACAPGAKKERRRDYQTSYRNSPVTGPRVKEDSRSRNVARYGITVEEYSALLSAQGGVCAVCGRPPKKKSLDIDHRHQRGEKALLPAQRRPMIRGLLCHLCNRSLGNLRDSQTILRRLADYVDNPPAQPILTKP